MRILVTLFFFFSFCFAKNFTIATYNVQNLFDIITDGAEYTEFNPQQNKLWNKQTQHIKLTNIAKVIRNIDADIIALQEIESKQALFQLQKLIPQYKYDYFIKDSSSAIGLAVLSKIKAKQVHSIPIDTRNSYSRPILELHFSIENKNFILFNNHWKSKRSPESYRIDYAYALNKRIQQLPKKLDFIILGDLNSNYNEKQTFLHDKNLNDTFGLTGINDVLNSQQLYNLWIELSSFNRFSYIYKGIKNTPDHIIVSRNLFDDIGISYIDDSFKVFKPKYLYQKNRINRWINTSNNVSGYSDHLPVLATFSTQPFSEKKHNIALDTIESLYQKESLDTTVTIKNAMVLYKYKNNAIIKQKNNRAIWLYNCAKDLKENYIYDLKINQIATYRGLKEVIDLEIIAHKNKINDKTIHYLDGNKIDLYNEKYQNEIISGLLGVYKNGYLYFDKKKIKLYFKDKNLLPKNGQKVIIHNAHLSNYNTKVQLVIYKQRDFDVI